MCSGLNVSVSQIHQIHTWILTVKVMVLGGRALWEVIRS